MINKYQQPDETRFQDLTVTYVLNIRRNVCAQDMLGYRHIFASATEVFTVWMHAKRVVSRSNFSMSMQGRFSTYYIHGSNNALSTQQWGVYSLKCNSAYSVFTFAYIVYLYGYVGNNK